MTPEEIEALRAQLEEAQTSIKGLESKNRELILKNKRIAEQNKEINVEEHFKMVEEYDTLKNEYDKLLKTYKSDTEKLTKSLSDKDSSLQRYLIEDGLSTTLAKSGVRPEFLEASKALLRQKASIKDENGELKAFLGDKSLSDAIAEWAQGDGKHFVSPPSSFGGGAGGGQGGGQKFDGTIPLDGSKADRLNAIKQKFLKE